jgi:hypothetical protein
MNLAGVTVHIVINDRSYDPHIPVYKTFLQIYKSGRRMVVDLIDLKGFMI